MKERQRPHRVLLAACGGWVMVWLLLRGGGLLLNNRRGGHGEVDIAQKYVKDLER
jgi:hypothetical protein